MRDDFRDWIGRGVARNDMATPRLLAEYRATLGPWLFETRPDVCPPGFHFALAPAIPGIEDTGPDGAERKGLFLPPIALPRRMWAGGSIETLRPIHDGEAVTRSSVISDIRFKEGASGPLCLVSIVHEITGSEGLMLRERQDLVFREAGARAEPAGPDQPVAADWMVEASPLLLFRFSAMTFNGHRIHYDDGYARSEGYPGLLVHGPLQAVLMLNLAAARLERVPRRFDYRCLAPLYESEFGVAWDDASGTARILRSDGVATVEGRVSGDHIG